MNEDELPALMSHRSLHEKKKKKSPAPVLDRICITLPGVHWKEIHPKHSVHKASKTGFVFSPPDDRVGAHTPPTQVRTFRSAVNPHILFLLVGGRAPASARITLTLQNTHRVCIFNIQSRASYSDPGEENEKEAKIGLCSVKSNHLCRCRGLRVGSGAGELTIAQHAWSCWIGGCFCFLPNLPSIHSV